jgi:hypothetical protein
MFYLCGSNEYMFWSCYYYTSRYGLAMAQHISSIFPYSPTGDVAASYTAQPLSVCFKRFMGGAKAWAGSMSSLTQLVCTPVTPMIA